jgi:hypothetical protein
MIVTKTNLYDLSRTKEKDNSLPLMLTTDVSSPHEFCRHKKPLVACRVCQMRTFLLVRKNLTVEHGFPLLIRDVCTLIFAHVQNHGPLNSAVWSLGDCGPLNRVPNSNIPLGAVCGVEYTSSSIPGFVVYCSRPAATHGSCGSWTCNAHKKRESTDCKRSRLPKKTN